MTLNRLLATALVLILVVHVSAFAAVRGKEVMYVGGTIDNVPEATQGRLDTSHPKLLLFTSKKGDFTIPYNGVTSLEYGQKAGRRLGVAVAITVWAMFSKKRKHFLTVGYTDDNDQPQGVVIELPKGTPKSIITAIEARSGVKCEYESEEARKHVHG
jgi:hypothetical protein